MVYVNKNEYKNNIRNKKVGWLVAESSVDENDIKKPEIITPKGDKKPQAKGILQRANRKNRNGRFYDDKELFPQLTCARSRELLATNTFGSENGHPMSKDLVRQQTIDPNNVVAYFTKLWTEGDFIWGIFHGSNLAIGKAFTEDLLDGQLMAWSLRALGSIENTARGAEVRGVKLITWDRVIYPSHPEAYTSGILTESAFYNQTKSGIYIPKTPIPDSCKNKTVSESGILFPVVEQNIIDYIKQESCNFTQICNEFEVLYDDIKLLENGNVQLSNSGTGNVFIVNTESYIKDEIMDYCLR